MRAFVLFSVFAVATLVSCNSNTSTTPEVVLTLSISGKINCPNRTLTTLNPSEYLITLSDSNGVERQTRPTADCKYAFNNLEAGHYYNLNVVRTAPSGSTVLSATAMENYLAQNPLPRRTDLGLMAADVNKDGEVDATDLLHVKRFVNGVTPSLPTNGGLWRFVPSVWVDANNNINANNSYGRWLIPNLAANLSNFDIIQVQYSDIDLTNCN
jgi:hypothetical protein